jgi:hypothetical protein
MTGAYAKLFKVKSFSDPNKEYIVRLLLPEGRWMCNCIFFLMNEGRMRREGLVPKCDHIRKVRHEKLKYHGRSK